MIVKEANNEYEDKLVQIDKYVSDNYEALDIKKEQLDFTIKKHNKDLEKETESIKKDMKIYKERESIKAKQELARKLASADNTEELMKIKIEELKESGDKQKEDLEIQLENVKNINESKDEKMECLDKLYDDIKEISLKLGDVKK
jgi:methyl-accepting chemotaxis protein